MELGNDQNNIRDVDLIQLADESGRKVRTRNLDLSFNELHDMHKSEELIIDPEYQRMFRWSLGKRSRFIESLLLEMPIPPIFVIELQDGVYELIDGLQRVNSYLHFIGENNSVLNEDGSHSFLELVECDILKELNGRTYKTLPKALAIKLKRSFVRVEVLRKESDQRLRYHMFKRLNTGGELASEQEVRNCTIRLLSSEFNDFIIELSRFPSFRTCIANLSEEKIEQKGDQELVLRFFAFKNYRDHYRHDVGDFMTEYMERVSDPDQGAVPFDYNRERHTFEKTFNILNSTLGENTFSGSNQSGRLIANFLSYHFEAFTLGLQPYLDRIDISNQDLMRRVEEVLLGVKKDAEFRRLTVGGGKNYSIPLRQRIAFVEQRLSIIQWT